jgi:hypothetical protein
VRVRGGEDQGTDVGSVQPVGEFAAEDAYAIRTTSAGDDLDAAEFVGLGGAEEGDEGLEGTVCGLAMQVEPLLGAQATGAEALPGGTIDAAGRFADGDGGLWRWGAVGERG